MGSGGGTVTWDEVRALALALPDTSEAVSWGSAHWRVHGKGFVWERTLRKKELAELGLDEQAEQVLGARVEDEAVKRALIEEDPAVFFTTAHFHDFPAILVWLDRIPRRRLEELIEEAWVAAAPPKAVTEWLAQHTD